MRPTDSQLRLLRAVDFCSAPDSPADGWGEVFTHFDAKGDRDDNPAKSLIMRNFDASAKACEARGWIVVAREEHYVTIALTEAGRAWVQS